MNFTEKQLDIALDIITWEYRNTRSMADSSGLIYYYKNPNELRSSPEKHLMDEFNKLLAQINSEIIDDIKRQMKKREEED